MGENLAGIFPLTRTLHHTTNSSKSPAGERKGNWNRARGQQRGRRRWIPLESGEEVFVYHATIQVDGLRSLSEAQQVEFPLPGVTKISSL